MTLDLKRVVELEWANYAALVASAQASHNTIEVIMRADVILNSSLALPLPDANHACLLRATPETADELISEIVDYFKAKAMPPLIWLSPACTPADLPQRLQARGFVAQPDTEAWMLKEHVQKWKAPALAGDIVVRAIGKAEAPLFAQTMVAAFEMPAELAPLLAQALEPSIGLAGNTYYIAYVDGQAAATLSLMCYQTYGTIGTAGVVKAHRGTRLMYTLANSVGLDAQRQGVDTIFLQTTLGPLFERFLRICGFGPAFRRTGYMLT